MKATILAVSAAVALGAAGGTGGWTVNTFCDGDEVRLSEPSPGVLRVDYSLAAANERLSGCTRYTGGWADLTLALPMALPKDARRIVFELKSVKPGPGANAFLNPIVVDEDGERFVFAYRPAPHLNGPEGSWTLQMTPDFLAGEAGAAAQDVYELDGDGVDFAPGRKLSLVGFRITLRRDQGVDTPRYRGSFMLGDFRPAPVQLPYCAPFAFVDGMCPEKGEFTVAVAVRDEFQAPPAAEFARRFSFDPEAADYEKTRLERIEMPVGPDGVCWIDYRVTDAAGGEVRSGSWREQVRGNPDRTPRAPVSADVRPATGVMRVGVSEAGRGVRERGDRSPLEVRLYPAKGERIDVEWRVYPCVCTNELASGSASVTGTGAPCAKLSVPLTVLPERDAYRMELTALKGGEAIGRETWFYGFRHEPGARHDRAGRRTDRRELKKRPYNRFTFLPRREDKPYSEDEYLADLDWFLKSTSEITTHFTYMVDLKDFEVLPGVYDTYLLDRVMDRAADYGCRVTVRAAHCDYHGRNLYRWNRSSRQYSYDGTVATGHAFYGAYSVTDPLTTGFWLDFYRALFERYDCHTAFEGYYLMQPGGEWTVVDQPWDGTFAGYDDASRRDFARWLSERYTIDDLKRRWDDPPASFDEVRAPLPDFRSGAKPDLRGEWLDFCRYKDSLGGEWMKRSVNDIRSYDDDRAIISYCSPLEVSRLLGDKLDYAHNGGNHYGDHLGDFIDAWDRCRVGWITEPHHPHAWAAYGDLGQAGWVLHWSMWIMTAQAAGGGANLHVYYNPWGGDLLDAYGGVQAYDMFRDAFAICDELHDMRVFSERNEIAFLSDKATLFAKHRTTFQARLADLRHWRDLIEDDVLPYGEYRPENAADYRLVLPNILDEVMEKSTYDALVAAVKGGAKTIITARTGSYVPDLGTKEPYRLLAAFGIPAPKGEFVRKGLDVRARAVTDGPLFAKGREIPFETADRQRAQLLDPEVQAEFWRYRWRFIPETDYFGYFRDEEPGGEALARFMDGGVAVSRHRFGAGEVIVFWGVPDICGNNLSGMMTRAARWAGVVNPLEGRPLRYCLEGANDALNRHYLLCWQERPGVYVVSAPHCPDGEFFLDDPVSCQRLGLYTGRELREKGVELTWLRGYSPLKFVRMIPAAKCGGPDSWAGKYR